MANDNNKDQSSNCVSSSNSDDDDDDDEEMEPLPCLPASVEILEEQNDKVIDTALKDLNPRWKNWVTRCIFGCIMITAFTLIIYTGPIMIMLLVFAIEFTIYYEIIAIAHVALKSTNVPCFRAFSWYFFIVANYYAYGLLLIEKFGYRLREEHVLLRYLVDMHYLLSYLAYMAGFVAYVLSLKKVYYLKQFTLFGYVHLALLIFVTSANCLTRLLFEGLVWFLLSTSLNIFNDIMAYMFGFFFGKTKLIELSPKKTWEGFVGAAVSTVIFAFILGSLMIEYKMFTCPIEYGMQVKSDECVPHHVFRVPHTMFMLHTLVISLFISLIGPFGGFFASGFKRAIGIKDFGRLIPGHGGVGDRFDCIHIIGTFVYVYYQCFINSALSPQQIFNQVLEMNRNDQEAFVRLMMLNNYLKL